jgi:hypothetical protein
MAKTGGTELNGLLASNFERVCGHKGYSHDYYQFNERVRATVNETNPRRWVRGKTTVIYTTSPSSQMLSNFSLVYKLNFDFCFTSLFFFFESVAEQMHYQ